MSAFTKLFGTHSERELKRIYPLVDKVESYRDAMGALSDEELRDKTKEYKERLEKGETLDDLLPEAYATVREAAKRVLGMEHYRVQIIGGIILHQGRIAEMKTGEGKTLVSTLPAYLNALEGKGVCIVTVNDYLAKRDSEWMGQIHEFLGLKVGVVLNSMTNDERREAYNCDITYVTNNELGFDYLRDNMVIYKEQLVQRGLHYAIIDEVDSVLMKTFAVSELKNLEKWLANSIDKVNTEEKGFSVEGWYYSRKNASIRFLDENQNELEMKEEKIRRLEVPNVPEVTEVP